MFGRKSLSPSGPQRSCTSTRGCRVSVASKVLAWRQNLGSLRAVATKLRRGVPLAAYAINWRCCYDDGAALIDEGMGFFMCLCCARRSPHIASARSNCTMWRSALSVLHDGGDDSGGPELRFVHELSESASLDFYGLQSYLLVYGHCRPDGAHLRPHLEEFENWKLITQFKPA